MKMVVYDKKPQTGQYFNFNSRHHLHQKLGVICTLIDRAYSIVSEEDDMRAEQDFICSFLKRCGYPEWTLMINKGPHTTMI